MTLLMYWKKKKNSFWRMQKAASGSLNEVTNRVSILIGKTLLLCGVFGTEPLLKPAAAVGDPAPEAACFVHKPTRGTFYRAKKGV